MRPPTRSLRSRRAPVAPGASMRPTSVARARHLFRALDEAIAIGRRAAVPVHISHLKCESASVWGRAGDALARVHEAGASADQYPYTAWASTLASLLPPWAAVGDLPRLIADPATRTRLVDSVERGRGRAVPVVGRRRRMGPDRDRGHGRHIVQRPRHRDDRHAARRGARRCLLRAPDRRPGHLVHRTRDGRARRAHDPRRPAHHGRLRRGVDRPRRAPIGRRPGAPPDLWDLPSRGRPRRSRRRAHAGSRGPLDDVAAGGSLRPRGSRSHRGGGSGRPRACSTRRPLPTAPRSSSRTCSPRGSRP